MSPPSLRPTVVTSAVHSTGQSAPRLFPHHPGVPQNLRHPKPHDAHRHRREGLPPLPVLVVRAVVHEEIFEARRGEHLHFFHRLVEDDMDEDLVTRAVSRVALLRRSNLDRMKSHTKTHESKKASPPSRRAFLLRRDDCVRSRTCTPGETRTDSTIAPPPPEPAIFCHERRVAARNKE